MLNIISNSTVIEYEVNNQVRINGVLSKVLVIFTINSDKAGEHAVK